MDFALQLAGLPPETLLEQARVAESLGFSSLYVPDHLAYEQPGSSLDDTTPAWEATAILGALAVGTTKLRLGGHVLCNLLRHPGLTAQATSTLDHLSGGRAILGLGAGWTRAEFAMMGIPFPDVKERLRMLDEAVRVIKRLFTEDRVDFTGEFYRLDGAFTTPRPVQKPRPPILLGGSGKGLLRIAAREADVVNVIVDSGRKGTVVPEEIAKLTEDGFRRKLDFVRDETRAAGRTDGGPTLSTTIFMLVVTDEAEQADQMAAGMAGAFGISPEEIRRMPIALFGTPEQCIAELRRREREWGIGHMVIGAGLRGGTPWERLGREVLPALRG